MSLRQVVAAVAAAALASACTGRSGNADGSDDAVAAAGSGNAESPYKPVATTRELMESIVAHAAEEYWGAVSIVVDESGITEHEPQTDEEWEEVWAAGLSIAESGNLLMMPPRAVDDGNWRRISTALVDVGLEAARAAEARDPEAVLEVGERVYNVCLECHNLYVPQ